MAISHHKSAPSCSIAPADHLAKDGQHRDIGFSSLGEVGSITMFYLFTSVFGSWANRPTNEYGK